MVEFNPINRDKIRLLLNQSGSIPEPRRRPGSTKIGSCMILFGGFNGSYFNDLYYLDLLDDGFILNRPLI